MKRLTLLTLIVLLLIVSFLNSAVMAAVTGNYTVTSYMGEQALPGQSGTLTLQGDVARMDMSIPSFSDPKTLDKTSIIINKQTKVFYWLFYKTKKGFRIKLDSKDGKDFMGKYSDKLKIESIDDLKKSMPNGAKLSELGNRTVNNMACVGYKVVTQEIKSDIWVSTQYKIPIKITTIGAGKTVYNMNKVNNIPDKPTSFFSPPKGFQLKDGFDIEYMTEAMGVKIPKNK